MSYERGTYKVIFEIQDKLMLKKRVSNDVPSNFRKYKKNIVSNPKSLKGKLEINQVTNILVQCVVRSIGVNAWWEWEISLVVEKRDIKLGIVLM